MQHLDVCRNGDANSAARVPYLLVVQADLLASLATRVVVPLIDRATLPGTPRADAVGTRRFVLLDGAAIEPMARRPQAARSVVLARLPPPETRP